MSSLDFSQFLEKPGEWLRDKGSDHDIVISSRIRLARNLRGYKFSPFLDDSNAKKMSDEILKAIGKTTLLKKNKCVFIESLDDVTRQILLERHLASTEFISKEGIRVLSFSDDEIVSIMINEEDHLRMQVLQSGFNLMETWRIMDEVDTQIASKIEFAYHPTLGFLTACPTNVGTGLRASCMLHLPSLVMTKQINKVLQAIAKLNLAVRGLYGEGTQASGNFFQFSNQVTLGKNEGQIVEDLEKIVRQIIEHEREARVALSGNKKDKLHDQIWRAVGALKAARIITSQESTALLSLVRLGVDLEIISGLDRQTLNKLFIFTQPAHLQLLAKKVISPQERDLRRAQLLRDFLKNVEL